ncbi:putative spermidine/putrescine transport system permease protein [Tranquillimonas rosea]|uniref:Putative spermidine/putrescine transport system permease protein n=1 Tax=Tranquillimonas rosea TaxID=641238 RepID=A0A1H9S6T4_9RHOB|nr:ABC transporter permease [Tranquillimonas rosea]SER80063.1 putative spermidine/putrescine transport system permease protein [Tranquillimonas rosea]
MPDRSFRYPLRWHVMDALERGADILWPATFSRMTGWLLAAPAILLVGLLVLGLIQIGDASMHVLDTSTFRMSEAYTLANYADAFTSAVYFKVAWRSLLAAALTTALTLAFAFPYAYAMVRTRSATVRKALLIALFLPFFIGQVVRAYGWLIILGNNGIVNDMLGVVGVEPIRLLFNFPAVIFGLVQYMLPFGVLMLAPALTAIPEETEIAAGSLGASWPRAIWHVILPMARPGLIGAGIVVFTLSLTDFAMPAILGGGSQDFIANAIYDQFFRTADQGLGSALALMLVALGSLIVGAVFTLFGAGTLALGARK